MENNQYNYYFLTDKDHHGNLIRQDQEDLLESRYDFKKHQWVNFNQLIPEYINPEGKYSGQYEIIEPDDAHVYLSLKTFIQLYNEGFVNEQQNQAS
jgi:hypothetical protein